jgi:hypothetical protein
MSDVSQPGVNSQGPSNTQNVDIPRKSRVSRAPSRPTAKNTSGTKAKGYKTKKPNGKTQETAEDDDESQCIICANEIKYAAVTSCNHTTCHKCTFRQRALYNKETCLVCRSENEKIIITEQIQKSFEEFSAKDFVKYDDKRKVEFTSDYCYQDTMNLMKNSCKICHSEFDTFKQLGDHAKTEHGKFYCFNCSEYKKAFISELPLYTSKQLQRHQSEGDQVGFNGHPECKYCHGRRFYSEDELNVHVRDRHERCYICDQYSPKTADYYKNYDSLYNHFKKAHFVCSVPICVEKRFVVFRDDLELTAHMLKEHGGLGNGSNKIVLGASGFQSQLSTFNENVARRNSNWESNTDEEDHSNPDVKKRRFEERAKHYVNYDQEKLQVFTNINLQYRQKKITANELLHEYKQLFTNESTENLFMLISELAELFPSNSDLHRNLKPVVEKLEQLNIQSQFPVLGGSNSGGSTPLNPSWVTTGTTKKSAKNNTNELFPALPKPSKQPPKINNAPIKYSRVILNPTPVAKAKINRQLAPLNYTPNYLNNLNQPTPVSSLPMLGTKSGGSTPRVQSPTVVTYASTPSSRSSLAQLSQDKFPALEKKTKKVVIPRVTPINLPDPHRWGSASTPPAPLPKEDPQDFGVGIVVKKKNKRR